MNAYNHQRAVAISLSHKHAHIHAHTHTHTRTHTHTHTRTQVVSHENKSKFTTISEQFQDLKTKFAVSEEMCKASKAQVWCVATCCSVFV